MECINLALKKTSSKVYCQKCKVRTNHGIILSHSEKSNDPWDIQWHQEYFIAQCLGCDTIAFISEYGDESMIEIDRYGEQEYFTDTTVYPEEPVLEKKMKFEPYSKKLFEEAPVIIQTMYSQIITAFNMESYLLAAVGLRMIVEGICKNLGIEEGYVLDVNNTKKLKKNSNNEVRSKSLEGKINGLVEKTLVIQSQANILHQIRELGNASAHELQNPKRKTVKLAIEILEKILEQIYELHKVQIR